MAPRAGVGSEANGGGKLRRTERQVDAQSGGVESVAKESDLVEERLDRTVEST